MGYWNDNSEEEKDEKLAQEATTLVENRKIPLPHLGFPHQEQAGLDIAKKSPTPSVQKEPNHTPSR